MNRKLSACRTSALILSALFFAFAGAHAQCKPDQPNPPSPAAQASVTLAGKSVTIDYCTPSVRGRKIFGELEPYGKVWRTGANSATTLKTAANLKIGTLDVPAGTYTIYSIPGEHSWTLIVNKQTGQWGTVYDESKDLGRTDMTVGKTSAPVEVFKISFEKTSGKSTQLHLIWENTDVYVPVILSDPH